MAISKLLPEMIVCVVFLYSHGVYAAPPAPAATPEQAELIRRGEYVARLGDCIACHTAPDGKPLAGGLELKTPVGSIHSTNITPDPKTGIGEYSFEQFDQAMRKGVAADGHNIYPAMPYPSYAKTSEEDMRALYAYLTQRVAPVSQPNQPDSISWPFSMRWGLSLWNWAFLDETPFRPDPNRDALWNRGAYLVQGLGHCGACHTPRGIAFQEKATSHESARGKFYLAGETVENWRARSLRNLWTVEDIVLLLKTGENRFGSLSGSMVERFHQSPRQFSDSDLKAIATYLKSLPPGKGELSMPAVPLRTGSATIPVMLKARPQDAKLPHVRSRPSP